MILAILGWIGALSITAGSVLSANKRKSCWIYYTLGSLIWIAYALATSQYSLVFVNCMSIAVNVYGFIKWSKT